MAVKKKNLFAALVKSIRKPNKKKKRKKYTVDVAKAIAASIGRKKYGVKRFQRMAVAAKKRKAAKKGGAK